MSLFAAVDRRRSSNGATRAISRERWSTRRAGMSWSTRAGIEKA